jgi:hypothetical protein
MNDRELIANTGAPPPSADDDDELVFEEQPDEDSQASQADGQARRIFTRISDPTVKDLFDRYKDGDLILQPDFQRYFVWDATKSSRLIESVMLDVPLPIVYLAEESDGSESVIDGQQRLTSFFRFLDGRLALSGLKIRADLNGLQFAQLEKALQTKLKRSTIRTITLLKESEKELKFEIFERLNTGSMALNDQELRNCVFRGPYNALLRELAAEPDFMHLLGIERPEKRMRDVELALRFASFFHKSYLQYRDPMKRFLNEDMERHQNLSASDAQETRDEFKKSIQLIRSMLGRNAFRRLYRGLEGSPEGRWEQKRFNASLYDVLMYGFTPYTKNQIFPLLDAIREGFLCLMTEDIEFIGAIELSTSSVSMVTVRFDKWRQLLASIVGTARTETRCFSQELKDHLYDTNPTCSICSQRIREVDDAAVDHIEQYWMGGKTIPENARLTHRFCNWARSRHD